MIRRAFLILAMLAAPLAARADLSRHDLVQDGLQRSYRLSCLMASRASPGHARWSLCCMGAAAAAAKFAFRRGGALANWRSYGFLVVYPDAVGRIWDTGAGMISSRLQPRRDDARRFLNG